MKNPIFYHCILFLFFYSPLFGQMRDLNGKVSSEDGAPLPGAVVWVKDQSKIIETDAQGNFNIALTKGEDVLEVSCVGFQTQLVAVEPGQKEITVRMQASMPLSEVVVTALGVKKRKNELGYATQEIKPEELTRVKTPNPIAALTGKVSGLTVYNKPGFFENPDWSLRGEKPLIAIDGVLVNSDAWDINSEDIESVNVLKGPTAAALYGSDAARGVVMITMKKGSEIRKETFDVSLKMGSVFNAGWVAFPERQTRYGTGFGGKYAFVDGKGGGVQDGDNWVWGPKLDQKDPSTPSGWWETPQYNSPVDPSTGQLKPLPWRFRGKDNLKRFLRPGYVNTYDFSASGKNDKGNIRLGFSHRYLHGQAPNTNLTIANASLAGGYQLTERFRFDAMMNYNRQYSPNYPRRGYGPLNIIYNMILWMGPEIDISDLKDYWQAGKEGIQQRNYNYAWYNNPWFMAYEQLQAYSQNKVYGNASLKYDFTDRLNLVFRQGFESSGRLYELKWPKSFLYYDQDTRGNYEVTQASYELYTTNLLLNYGERFGRFGLQGLLGGESKYFHWRGFYSTTDRLWTPGLYSLDNTIGPIVPNQRLERLQKYSLYATVDLDYNRMIYLGLTGRRDYDSSLPASTNYYDYPSVSTGLILSRMIDLPRWVGFLKIRGSWARVRRGINPDDNSWDYLRQGVNPNDQSGKSVRLYDYLATYRRAYPFGFVFPSFLGNPALRSSLTTTYETGLEANFFRNRLTLDATVYYNLDQDEIVKQSISNTSGYREVLTNANQYVRKGVELSLSASPIKTSSFQWTTTLNGALYRRYLKAIDPRFGDNIGGIKAGERTDQYIGSAWKYSPDGRLIIGQDGLPVKRDAPILLGYIDPDWELGWAQDFSYKNLTLSFLISARLGGGFRSTMAWKMWWGGTHPDSVSPEREAAYRGEKFIPEGVNEIKKPDGSLSYEPNRYASNWVDFVRNYYAKVDQTSFVDGSFIKLRQVSLNFDFPKNWLESLKLRKASFSIVADNVWLWTKVRLVDPDGKDDNKLQEPSARTIGFVLSVNF